MKVVFIYVSALVIFWAMVWLTFEQGRKLDAPMATVSDVRSSAAETGAVPGVEPSASLFANLRTNLQDPLPRLFLQLIVILLAARLAGALVVNIHQPAVIGEMIAGILLGPSLLGWLWPD